MMHKILWKMAMALRVPSTIHIVAIGLIAGGNAVNLHVSFVQWFHSQSC